MRITKYPQSTFLIESWGKRILIDPGSFTLEKFDPDHFGKLEGILITHQHLDHLNIKAILHWHHLGVPIFGNFDVFDVLESEGIRINKVGNQKEFKIDGLRVKPVDLPHCKMLDGSDGPPNTGFLIDEVFFHPGDGVELEGLKVKNAGIPITGPTIDYQKAWNLALSLGAKRVIPMHYSNPKFVADPQEFAKENRLEIEVVILEDGASVAI